MTAKIRSVRQPPLYQQLATMRGERNALFARVGELERAVESLTGLGIALSDEHFTPSLRTKYRDIIREIHAQMSPPSATVERGAV